MEENNVINMNETTIEEKKYSVAEFLDNPEILEVTYLPFDSKLELASHVLVEVVKAIGGLNTSLLRRISTEAFIEAVSNIDMNVTDDNGLKGFDQLYYHGKLEYLLNLLGREYAELQHILDERTADYIRTETNPAVTINGIYERVRTVVNATLDQLSNVIQNIDVQKLTEQITPLINKDGEPSESK